MVRKLAIILIVPSMLLWSGCGQPKKDHDKDPWLQHQPTAWTTTPAGHVRDAGPFPSVEGGWVSDAEIDKAIDDEFARFAAAFPELAAPNVPVTLNDDYAMWVSFSRTGNSGAWAAGTETTGVGNVGVVLWSRLESAGDPGPAFIVRPPGDYWGVRYSNWRRTDWPIVPALAHELLHACIGDTAHQSILWARLN